MFFQAVTKARAREYVNATRLQKVCVARNACTAKVRIRTLHQVFLYEHVFRNRIRACFRARPMRIPVHMNSKHISAASLRRRAHMRVSVQERALALFWRVVYFSLFARSSACAEILCKHARLQTCWRGSLHAYSVQLDCTARLMCSRR